MQRDFWVKNRVFGQKACAVKNGVLGGMAMQRDFWVKDGVWGKVAVQKNF